VVAPLTVLRDQDIQRLQLDLPACQARARLLQEASAGWQDKLPLIYAKEEFAASADPEQQLYDGFLGERDRRLCEQVRRSEPEQLGRQVWPFDDLRLPELLFRYRARNFPQTLSASEQQQWLEFCRQRLQHAELGAPNTLAEFLAAEQTELLKSGTTDAGILHEWHEYVMRLTEQLGLPMPDKHG
jgi:exodeoxyribonuclease-1